MYTIFCLWCSISLGWNTLFKNIFKSSNQNAYRLLNQLWKNFDFYHWSFVKEGLFVALKFLNQKLQRISFESGKVNLAFCLFILLKVK